MEGVNVGDFKLDEEVVREVEPEEKSYDLEEVLDAVAEENEEIFADDIDEETRKKLVEMYFPLPEDFPTKEELDGLASKFGRLRIHRMNPGEAYVVRPLSRPEYRQYLDILKGKYATAEEAASPSARMDQEEMLVEKCLVYPKVTKEQLRGTSDNLHKIAMAGTISILAYDIEEISNLIDTAIGPFEEL